MALNNLIPGQFGQTIIQADGLGNTISVITETNGEDVTYPVLLTDFSKDQSGDAMVRWQFNNGGTIYKWSLTASGLSIDSGGGPLYLIDGSGNFNVQGALMDGNGAQIMDKQGQLYLPTGSLLTDANGGTYLQNQTPATSTAAGVAGQVCWDANYLYVCIAANVWKRTPLATW